MVNILFGKGDFGNTPYATNSDFERCADYVHFNPVKHRLATSPSDWPFSSLHRYVRAGILPPDWGGDGSTDTSNFGERKD